MIVYLFIATFIYWGAWTKYSSKVWKIGLLFLWFFIAFRALNLGGSDGYVYQSFYEIVPQLAEFPVNPFQYEKSYIATSGFGWGYAIICSVAKMFGPYEFFQVMYTSLMFSVLYLIIKEIKINDCNRCLFLFSYLTLQLLWYFCGLLRQSLANLIVWFVLVHRFQKHGWIKRVLLMIVAYTIHTSVLACAIGYIFLIMIYEVPEKIVAGTSLAVGTFVFVLGDRLVSNVISWMMLFVDDRYEMYSGNTDKSNAIYFVLRGLILILMLVQFKRLPEKNRKRMLDSSALCFFLGSINHALAVRMIEYFMIGNYYGLGLCVNAFSKRSINVVRLIVYLALMMVFVRFFFVNGSYLQDYAFFF